MAEPAFRNGRKIGLHGELCTIDKIKTPVSSNGVTQYATILWSDETISCNCPGWAVKKKGKDYRECRHTRESMACDYTDMQDPAALHIEVTAPAPPPGPRTRFIRT
jgi:hypothetical protein